MSEVVTRRSLVTAGVATAAGVAGLGGAAYLADQYGLIPPDHQGIVGFGERSSRQGRSLAGCKSPYRQLPVVGRLYRFHS